MQGKHLTHKERFYIEKRRGDGVNQATIARELELPRSIAKRLNFDYTIWTENKLSVSQPISLFLLFACAHLCSIGLRSGEYVGKYSTIYPASMMTC